MSNKLKYNLKIHLFILFRIQTYTCWVSENSTALNFSMSHSLKDPIAKLPPPASLNPK